MNIINDLLTSVRMAEIKPFPDSSWSVSISQGKHGALLDSTALISCHVNIMVGVGDSKETFDKTIEALRSAYLTALSWVEDANAQHSVNDQIKRGVSKFYWNGYLVVKTRRGRKPHLVLVREDQSRSISLCRRTIDTTNESGLVYPGKANMCRICQGKFDHPEI